MKAKYESMRVAKTTREKKHLCVGFTLNCYQRGINLLAKEQVLYSPKMHSTIAKKSKQPHFVYPIEKSELRQYCWRNAKIDVFVYY